jgi:hypothetical protein
MDEQASDRQRALITAGACIVVLATRLGFLVGAVFFLLKVLGAVGWSWWWVLLPFYGPFLLKHALGLAVAVFADLPDEPRPKP